MRQGVDWAYRGNRVTRGQESRPGRKALETCSYDEDALLGSAVRPASPRRIPPYAHTRNDLRSARSDGNEPQNKVACEIEKALNCLTGIVDQCSKVHVKTQALLDSVEILRICQLDGQHIHRETRSRLQTLGQIRQARRITCYPDKIVTAARTSVRVNRPDAVKAPVTRTAGLVQFTGCRLDCGVSRDLKVVCCALSDAHFQN